MVVRIKYDVCKTTAVDQGIEKNKTVLLSDQDAIFMVPIAFILPTEGLEYFQAMELFVFIVRLLLGRYLRRMVICIAANIHSRFIHFQIQQLR